MHKQILRLAIPNIISNLTVPLLGLVDTALMGHLDSEIYIGAIALGGIIFNFIFWSFGFLRMGTTGLTAQAYGANHHQESFYTLARALGVAFLGAIVLLVFQVPIAELAFWLLEGSPKVEKLAREYFYIRIYAAPATVGLYALTGWFLGMQNARVPMFTAILVNVVNVGLDYHLVYNWHMKSDGVAWGTVCAQYSGLVFALAAFILYYRRLLRYWEIGPIVQKESLIEFFKLNHDILIRTMVLVFAFSFFYSESVKQGNLLLAVNSILLQFNMMMAFGVDGFAFAAESLVGKHIGARNPQLLRKTIQYIFIWGLGLSLVFTLVYGIAGYSIIKLLTNQLEVIAESREYILWVIIAPTIHSICFIWDGIYIGATASRPMRNSTFIATFLVFLPSYYLSEPVLGNHALWLAMTLFMAARGITLSIWARACIFLQD